MRGCALLPADIQRCMNPSYNRTHERSCRRALRTAVVDPLGRERHRVVADDVEREADQREPADVEEPAGPTRLGDEPEALPGDGETAAGG